MDCRASVVCLPRCQLRSTARVQVHVHAYVAPALRFFIFLSFLTSETSKILVAFMTPFIVIERNTPRMWRSPFYLGSVHRVKRRKPIDGYRKSGWLKGDLYAIRQQLFPFRTGAPYLRRATVPALRGARVPMVVEPFSSYSRHAVAQLKGARCAVYARD